MSNVMNKQNDVYRDRPCSEPITIKVSRIDQILSQMFTSGPHGQIQQDSLEIPLFHSFLLFDFPVVQFENGIRVDIISKFGYNFLSGNPKIIGILFDLSKS